MWCVSQHIPNMTVAPKKTLRERRAFARGWLRNVAVTMRDASYTDPNMADDDVRKSWCCRRIVDKIETSRRVMPFFDIAVDPCILDHLQEYYVQKCVDEVWNDY